MKAIENGGEGGAKDYTGPNVLQSYHCIIKLNRVVGSNTCMHLYVYIYRGSLSNSFVINEVL